jgi:divalent metal cation (Fe/Co/Zn/Cd) transporter
VREIHNVSVVRVGNRTEVSLHLKLPGEISLDEAHAVASRVEAAIAEALPDVDAVSTHLEPLAETGVGAPPAPGDAAAEEDAIRAIVRAENGAEPLDVRLLETDAGLIVYLTLGVDPDQQLAEAHDRARAVKARIREARPQIADVLVHTEPGRG